MAGFELQERERKKRKGCSPSNLKNAEKRTLSHSLQKLLGISWYQTNKSFSDFSLRIAII